jgi:hypothetical protein
MRIALVFILVLVASGPASARGGLSPAKAQRFVEEFTKAVEKVNRAHAASPGKAKEADLAKKLPRSLMKGLDGLLAMEPGEAKWESLVAFGRAAADLDLIDDIRRVEKALRGKKGSAEAGAKFGRYISRPRFLLHALRVEDAYANDFARAFEGVLEAYDRTFGFEEFSKVPGKKIRVLLHREDRPRAPHFAPQYPFHSAIDFPVAKGDEFTSPTRDGKFLFYGLCHELGHLIAMWGDRRTEEDHHAWAHYTGIVVLEECSKQPWAKKLRDLRWRSVEKDAGKLKDTAPSKADRAGVLKLLLTLHRLVGPKRIGQALNLMDEKDMGHRINHVRYYGLRDFEKALLAGSRSKAEKAKIRELFK